MDDRLATGVAFSGGRAVAPSAVVMRNPARKHAWKIGLDVACVRMSWDVRGSRSGEGNVVVSVKRTKLWYVISWMRVFT